MSVRKEMDIGVVKEIKNQEYRVAFTPHHALELTQSGHRVLVENNAGIGSGFSNDHYYSSGAELCDTAQTWDADLVLKVKEPLAEEYAFLQGQILFTFLHLAGTDPVLTEALLDSKISALAYETLEDEHGRLPLLAPMSAIAGNMATQMGSYYLARIHGGKGVQLGRVLGAGHGKVLVVGDGVVGQHAATVACALGAEVTIAGLFPERITVLKQQISPQLQFIESTTGNISAVIADADLVIGAVLCRGQKAPFVISESMVKTMQPGSVIVDVSIDQGGCIETSRPTSHDHPVFVLHGVIHYCVTNMPGAFPRTSTLALTTATWPYIERLVAGIMGGLKNDAVVLTAFNTYKGYVVNAAVAKSLGLNTRFRQIDELLIA
ncbi:MAG: alanine dehydrogenase [Methylococcales bacterium]